MKTGIIKVHFLEKTMPKGKRISASLTVSYITWIWLSRHPQSLPSPKFITGSSSQPLSLPENQ
jgi:hypothetical protein